MNFHPFSFSSAALLKYPLVFGKKAGGEQDTTVPSRWAWPRSPSLCCGHALGFGAMGFATFPGTPELQAQNYSAFIFAACLSV